jgi:subtilisin family serine protease
MIRRAAALLLLLVSVSAAAGAQTVATRPRESRVIVIFRPDAAIDRYAGAFVYDDRLQDTARFGYHSRAVLGAIMSLERRYGFRATAFFSRTVKGFAATLPPAIVAKLAVDPMVLAIEPDEAIRLAPLATAVGPATQVVDWGITKIGADADSTHSGDGSGAVTGVNVYVIDTGVDPTHPDINLVNQVSFVPNEPNQDCNGHGTAVAGIIAGRDNDQFTVGVAPGAPVTAVKVIGCAGITFPSMIIQGIDWVTAQAVKPAVVNMSLGSLIPLAGVNTAVLNSAASGIFYAVAAGNGNPFANNAPLNGCNTSPASAGYSASGVNGIVTAGATDEDDRAASFSNYGPCVDIYAPGVRITAPWLMSEGGTITASGTSFAAPHVAGAAALLFSQIPTAPPWYIEFLIKLTAVSTGTTAFDGAPIRRLDVRLF